MAELADLEARILAAFARISAGVEALNAADMMPQPMVDPAATLPNTDAIDDLQAELEDERQVTSQLADRMRVLRDQASSTETVLRGEVETLTRALDAQGLDVHRLTATVTQLREDLRRLREAAEQGVVDPALINRAMMAELDALRATRAAEVNEMSHIMSALGPILDAEEVRAHA